MTLDGQARLRQSVILVAVLLSAGMGLSALAGWALNIDTLKSLIPNAVQMKPNAAVGLVMAGLSLLLASRSRGAAGLFLADTMAIAVAVLGLATMGEYLFVWDLGIDQLLFVDLASSFNKARGRMSPFSAWCLTVIGIGLFGLRRRRAGWLVNLCAGQTAIVGSIVLLGYLWNASDLITDKWLPPVAINTALALLSLGLGMMARNLRRKSGDGAGVGVSRVELKLMLGLFFTLVVLTASASYTYRAVLSFSETTASLAATQHARLELYKTLHASSLMLANYRASRMTGDDEYLQLYRGERERSEAARASLQSSQRVGSAQMARVEALNSLIAAQFEALAPASLPQDRQGAGVAGSAADIDAGLALAAEINRLGREIEREYRFQLIEQSEQLEQGRTIMLVSLIVSIGLAAAAFGTMMTSVRREMRLNQQARAEISDLNAQLERRVEERTSELKEANERMNAFTYALAHDLRQPLISAGGFGQLLDQRLELSRDSEGRKYLKRIRRSIQQVNACTDALLELGQVSRTRLRLREVNLTGLAEHALASLGRLHPERHVRATVQPGMTATADHDLLSLALGHLISNAWKFTSAADPAHIEIGCGRDPAGAPMWWVKDNGAGFDMAYAGKLFTSFQRLHRVDEFAGLGTGLTIVHAVVSRHKGLVWTQAAQGEGATFFFTLGGAVAVDQGSGDQVQSGRGLP